MGRHHREKCVGDDNIHILVVAEQGRRRQVVELGEVRASIPVNGQLGQLLQRPVVARIAFSELVNVKPGPHGIGVDVERLGEKVLPLLRIVDRLQGVVEDVRRPDADAVCRVGHL